MWGVWSVKKVNPQSMVHLTEKPVELAKRAIEYSSLKGQNVLDLFGGSGSTLIAAEITGRRAFLMELDPLYCDVIVQRYEKLTGKKPVLEGRSEIDLGVLDDSSPGPVRRRMSAMPADSGDPEYTSDAKSGWARRHAS